MAASAPMTAGETWHVEAGALEARLHLGGHLAGRATRAASTAGVTGVGPYTRPVTATPDAALRTALARGRRDDVVALMLASGPDERRRLRPLVTRFHRVVTAHPTGARAPDGEWSGPLRPAHWSAAAAALLACSTLAQAVRYAPLDQPDAADLPRALFPGDLDAFAAEWSARFVRNPKAWDRIRGLDAMFDWAHEGLIDPPQHDGAVLYLVTAPPGGPGGAGLLGYLERRPCLIHTTMARIFDVDGIKGASPAQADETNPWPQRRLDTYVIPELIRRGHWTSDMVLAGIDRAQGRDLGRYQHRWFGGLRAAILALGPT